MTHRLLVALFALSACGHSTDASHSDASTSFPLDGASNLPPLSAITLTNTTHVCDLIGLGGIGSVPFNFPGAASSDLARWRSTWPGLVETSIDAGANPNVPRIYGTDLGLAFEHSDGKMYFHFGDTAFPPDEGIDPSYCTPGTNTCQRTTVNDDVLASTTQTDDPDPTRCLSLEIPALDRDSTEFHPITQNGYEREGGTYLGSFVVPGPGFSTGNAMFALMPGTTPIACSNTGSTNNCASVGGIEGDICRVANGQSTGFCYFGTCSADPQSPCSVRLNPATLGVRNQGVDYRPVVVGQDVTSANVTTAYRGHFATVAIAPVVDFKTNSGQVWVFGRDSFWGAHGITMSPYLFYHPVMNGQIGEAQYFAGINENKPVFTGDRTLAQPVYQEEKLIPNHTTVSYLPAWDGGTWVMIYGGRAQVDLRTSIELLVAPVSDDMFYDQNAGIYLRWAKQPWGPWSDAVTIFNPFTPGQGGYCDTMYFEDPGGIIGWSCPPEEVDHNTSLNRITNEGLAGEYGAGILARFARTLSDGTGRFFWLMSTWNPYRVIVMQSDVGFHH